MRFFANISERCRGRCTSEIFRKGVGADAHIGPRSMHGRNAKPFGEFDGSHRADVGIGPYKKVVLQTGSDAIYVLAAA